MTKGWDGGLLYALTRCDSCSRTFTCGDHVGQIDPELEAWRRRNWEEDSRAVSRQIAKDLFGTKGPWAKLMGTEE